MIQNGEIVMELVLDCISKEELDEFVGDLQAKLGMQLELTSDDQSQHHFENLGMQMTVYERTYKITVRF